MLTLRFPWPPSTNELWRAVRGRNIKSEAYRKWQEVAGWELQAQRPQKLKGPVRLSIWLTPPTRRGFDLDNRCKAALDLLVAHQVIEDDDSNTVREIHLGLDAGREAGARVEIVPL